jgi:hypothetical protein
LGAAWRTHDADEKGRYVRVIVQSLLPANASLDLDQWRAERQPCRHSTPQATLIHVNVARPKALTF